MGNATKFQNTATVGCVSNDVCYAVPISFAYNNIAWNVLSFAIDDANGNRAASSATISVESSAGHIIATCAQGSPCVASNGASATVMSSEQVIVHSGYTYGGLTNLNLVASGVQGYSGSVTVSI